MGFRKGQVIQRENGICNNEFLHWEQDKMCSKGRQAKKVITDFLLKLTTIKEVNF